MLRFAVDQNFDHNIIRGLLRHHPSLDVVIAHDVGLSEADDPTLLAWAAGEGRVMLTHDVNTMTRFAHERVSAGLSMPGVMCVGHGVSIGEAIQDLLLVLEVSVEGDWEGKVEYLPL